MASTERPLRIDENMARRSTFGTVWKFRLRNVSIKITMRHLRRITEISIFLKHRIEMRYVQKSLYDSKEHHGNSSQCHEQNRHKRSYLSYHRLAHHIRKNDQAVGEEAFSSSACRQLTVYPDGVNV